MDHCVMVKKLAQLKKTMNYAMQSHLRTGHSPSLGLKGNHYHSVDSPKEWGDMLDDVSSLEQDAWDYHYLLGMTWKYYGLQKPLPQTFPVHMVL